jgi:predicted ArsR family transcriptional regulator
MSIIILVRMTLKFRLVEHNCAISHIATSFPGVCGHKLDICAATRSDCEVKDTQSQKMLKLFFKL